jgi:hypothetical protein
MAPDKSSSLQNDHYGAYSFEYKSFLESHDPSAMEGLAKLTPQEVRSAIAGIEKNASPPWKNISTEDRTFKASDGTDIGVRVWANSKSSYEASQTPLILILHGGGTFSQIGILHECITMLKCDTMTGWIYGGHDSESGGLHMMPRPSLIIWH